MIITKALNLYLGAPAAVQRPVFVSQNDTGWAFACTIYQGADVWTIPSGTTATINGSKPDGTAFSYTCTISGNVVTAPCEEQMTVVPGNVDCEIKFTQGGRVIATANFRLIVEESPTGEYKASETELGALDDALDEVQTIAAQVRAAYGAPLTAATSSAMTDTSRVYVYTGTTSGGFTKGNWYYYNGSSWVSGGVYNSTAFETDATLSISGAAADAKATGDAVGDLKSSIGDVTELLTLNLIDEKNLLLADGVTESNGVFTLTGKQLSRRFSRSKGEFPVDFAWKENTKYTLRITARNTVSRTSAKAWSATFDYTDGSSSVFNGNTKDSAWTAYSFTSDESKTVKALYFSYSNYGDDVWNWKNMVLTEGDGSYYTAYHITGIDLKARPLSSTGDETDRTSDIMARLTVFGYCEFGAGEFYTTGITMPDATTIKGQGAATKLMLLPGSSGNVITLGSRCNVQDITLSGDAEDITLDGDVFGTPTCTEDTSSTNLWGGVDVNVPSDAGFVHIVLDNPLPPGFYKMSALINTSGTSRCYVAFSRSTSTGITAQSIFADVLISPNVRETTGVYLTETAYSMRFCSAETATAGVGTSADWTNINITASSQKNGIVWNNVSGDPCFVSNCIIERLNGAGILLQDTMTPVDKGLCVTNCWIRNNNAGIFIRKDSEFNKFTNCTITRNYYGYYNRGGNNYIANSGIDGNTVNVRIDDLEGSNGGHGSITGCSLNHAGGNSGYSLIISGTGRMAISNCGIYYGKILLEKTNGNIIAGCTFGRSAGWEITGGDCSIFANCIVFRWEDAYTPVTITNNTAAKIVNCYSRGGVPYAS